MYGKKYIHKYKKKILEMFLRGAEESSKKKGPGAMLEQLRADNPGVYTLPNFIEVQGEVGRLFEKQKKAGGRTTGLGEMGGDENSDVEDNDDDVMDDAAKEEVEKCREIIKRYGGEIKPDWVKRKVRDELGRNELLCPDDHLKKTIKSTRDSWLKLRIQSIIG